GVGRGGLIGVCAERAPELIAAILGVLKAGAAYVPLDPDSPPARRAAIVAETGAAVVLTQEAIRNAGERPLVAPRELTRPAAHELAYVIPTSGSTGRPKGVMVEHAAVCNTVLWRLRDLPLRPGDRVLLNLPVFFDASVTAIFPTLVAGAELVLAAPGEERDPGRLL